jgi:hypothetical protein
LFALIDSRQPTNNRFAPRAGRALRSQSRADALVAVVARL